MFFSDLFVGHTLLYFPHQTQNIIAAPKEPRVLYCSRYVYCWAACPMRTMQCCICSRVCCRANTSCPVGGDDLWLLVRPQNAGWIACWQRARADRSNSTSSSATPSAPPWPIGWTGCWGRRWRRPSRRVRDTRQYNFLELISDCLI